MSPKKTGSANLVNNALALNQKLSSTKPKSSTVAPRSTACQAPVQIMVSKGTETNDQGVTIEEKRKLIRKQLGALLHAVLCRVRDELIGNNAAAANSCPTKFCGLMKSTLNHLKTCIGRHPCLYPHCLSSRQILSHWKLCKESDCQVCSSYRKVVPDYLKAVTQNPLWRGELLRRFQWLFSFIGSPSLQSVQLLHQQQLTNSRDELAKEAVEE